MDNELLPEAAYQSLPAEGDRKFVRLMTIAQSNLLHFLSGSGYSAEDSQYAWELRTQFMEIGRALANEFAVTGLPDIDSEYNNSDESYGDFTRKMSAIFARVRARHATSANDTESVQLGYKTKGWLRQEIEQLRAHVERSELSKNKKEALLDKLADMLTEIDKERLSFARTMAIAASIAGILGGGSTAIIQAPKIYDMFNNLIMRIGEDKAKEDDENLRLTGSKKELPSRPQPTLPPPEIPWSTETALTSIGRFDERTTFGRPDNLDDDIPF